MHSQSQTVQEPLSAELTPVRLHPAVQFPAGKEKTGCCHSACTESRPTPTGGICSHLPVGGQEEGGDRGRGSWKWALTHPQSHRRPRAPLPVDGCQCGIYTWSCPRPRRIGRALALHPMAQRPREKVRFDCGGRKEEAPGQRDRHNLHSRTSTGHTRRPRSLSLVHSQHGPLELPCESPRLSQETTDPGGPPCTFSLLHSPAPTQRWARSILSEPRPSGTSDAPLRVSRCCETRRHSPTHKTSPKAQLSTCFPSASHQRLNLDGKKALKKPDNVIL